MFYSLISRTVPRTAPMSPTVTDCGFTLRVEDSMNCKVMGETTTGKENSGLMFNKKYTDSQFIKS